MDYQPLIALLILAGIVGVIFAYMCLLYFLINTIHGRWGRIVSVLLVGVCIVLYYTSYIPGVAIMIWEKLRVHKVQRL